ncbi:hypothetical protein [Leifsonia sp. TF02-11]|uniref:NADase-type glycan-binding domain-containing protein n=1 Tax=Leifsonia sp. TF02-11 TaxID=2815212 RepID=UPI001AA1185A|nr:hypothetical protein [Leifsonia sp. TF02-11]MBO1741321.1 hypothetical protein [Leifsonia sp. TF02-11]
MNAKGKDLARAARHKRWRARVLWPSLLNAGVTTFFVVIFGSLVVNAIVGGINDMKAADAASCSAPNNLILLGPSQIHAEGGYLTYTSTRLKKTYVYPPSSAFDGSLSTAWVAPEKNGGVGRFITVTFRGHAHDVRLICIVNGYANGGLSQAVAADGSGFLENGSVGAITITTDTGSKTSSLPSLDTTSPFRFVQPLTPTGETTSVKFTVKSYVPPLDPSPNNGPVSASITEIQVWVMP